MTHIIAAVNYNIIIVYHNFTKYINVLFAEPITVFKQLSGKKWSLQNKERYDLKTANLINFYAQKTRNNSIIIRYWIIYVIYLDFLITLDKSNYNTYKIKKFPSCTTMYTFKQLTVLFDVAAFITY